MEKIDYVSFSKESLRNGLIMFGMSSLFSQFLPLPEFMVSWQMFLIFLFGSALSSVFDVVFRQGKR